MPRFVLKTAILRHGKSVFITVLHFY
jgi:hypothetical protein